MMRATACLLTLSLTLCLAACAGSASNYPSLAMRDVERVTGTAEPVEAEVAAPLPPPASAELQDRIAHLVANARMAHNEFVSRQDASRRIVASSAGAAPASENWTQAQVALAGLTSRRSEALISLAELDQLYAAERIAFPDAPTPSALALAAARDQVNGWVSQEDEAIAALRRLF